MEAVLEVVLAAAAAVGVLGYLGLCGWIAYIGEDYDHPYYTEDRYLRSALRRVVRRVLA